MTGEEQRAAADGSVFSRHRVAFWTVLALLLLGVLFEGADLVAIVSSGEASMIAGIGGAIQIAALLLIALVALPSARELRALLLPAAVLGALFAGGAAGMVNNGSALIAPFAEEMLKLVCVAALVWLALPARRGPTAGLILGFFVGLGFEVIEDVGYAVIEGAQSGSGSEIMIVIGRTINGLGLHNFCTAIAGAGLAYALWRGGRAWWIAVAGLATAIAIHFVWDNFQIGGLVGSIVIYLIMIACFVVVRVWSVRAERASATQA